MKKITLLIILLSLSQANVYADTLMIDKIEEGQSISMPARGITMNQVLKQFGEPSTKKTAVGEPPITEWQYDKFSVYFEHKWVINSVAYKNKK